MRTLIFSGAGSPFARKVRIVLAEMGLSYDEDIRPGLRPPEELASLNPALALPVLRDGEELLFGSDLIIEFLLERYPAPEAAGAPPFAARLTRPDAHWRDRKTLATINAFADTVVNTKHFRGEGVTGESSRYMARQEARLRACLDWLEKQATGEGFWPGFFSVMDIALICPLDYAETRGVIQWRDHPKLVVLYERWRTRPSVRATAEG
ncbi:MAG TPA: glutathione S-transferase family protein [Stellaceae bacterium]|nr:glutathione S-transferase family protein [Stellaceae bacterium]